MERLARLPDRWRNFPLIVGALVALLLLAGVGVIVQSESAYRDQRVREDRVQAEILAASVTAALDFGDAAAAQEAVNALRVNPEVRAAAVYDSAGALLAGYERGGARLPRSLNLDAVPDENRIRVVVPVESAGERVGSVYLETVREPLSRRLTRYGLIALLVVMAAVVVGVLGIATSVLRRANRELESRATQLVDTNSALEVQMEERAKAEEELRQAQKMQALGQLTGGIAHDFNNLLTVIQGSADMLRRPGLSEEKRLRYAEAIVHTSDRAAALTRQLLAFARRQPLKPEQIDLNQHIQGMTELLDRALGERIEIRTDLAPDLCRVEADPAQLESALLNVAVNARDAMPGGGVLTITTAMIDADDPEARKVSVCISDTGTGIDTETLARVMEPFFTTKDQGKGTGLGLSQVYGFATQSGGDVRIDSAPGKGTRVAITLPCSREAPVEKADEQAAPRSAYPTGHVLLVDDNEEVGAFAEALLGELGHSVVRARSGPEAIEYAREERFDVVFTDVVMPGMSGLQLAELLRDVQPEAQVVLTTGYSHEIAESGTGGLPVLYKPYRLDSLAEMLGGIMGKRGNG